MLFSESVWQRNQKLYEKTLAHPFNQELAMGTLNREAFCHYVIQDAHYLVAYGRALSVCAAKAYDSDAIIQFSQGAKEAIIVERELHNGFMKEFGITQADFENTPLTAACHHYTSFLTATAWSESYPVVLASLLPCYWIYAEVGKDILKRNTINNPYQDWIDTYAGEHFNEEVKKVIHIIDRVAAQSDAETIKKMHEAYTKGAELEYLFWDSAYHQEKWLSLDH